MVIIIGSLVGYSEWEVTDSYAAGNVDGKAYVGGLAEAVETVSSIVTRLAPLPAVKMWAAW